MTWWIWVLFGLALLASEIVVPGGIFMLFFGAAALLVGLLVAVGMGGGQSVQWLLFSVLSVASLLTLRGPILRRMESSGHDGSGIDAITGSTVQVGAGLEPGSECKVELRGSSWTARNVGSRALPAGAHAIVDSVEGLTLHIKEIGS